ncbi:MAG TPA: DUF2188 domain-containing protein [Acholeplasma sp.]|nr:DUF2188 domain-containing protein [Acholeplasma sp.]
MQTFLNDYGVYLIIGLLLVLLVLFYFVNKNKSANSKKEVNELPKKDDVIVEIKTKPVLNDTSVKPKVEEKAPGNKKITEETSNEDDDPTKDVMSKDKPARYHVSQNKDDKSQFFKKWRVRKEGSSKTIKYYDTQKEAIEVAEDLAEKAGTSIVIHKIDGKIRKQDYTKK